MNRIDGLNPLHTSRTLGGSSTAAVGSSSQQRDNGADEISGKQDAVMLSFRSREMADVSHAVLNAPEVRTDRVSALRAQIANGSYQSNAREIATRLLSSGTFGE
jgi:flagellar biosynthesis anti-sigma factor FlgM